MLKQRHIIPMSKLNQQKQRKEKQQSQDVKNNNVRIKAVTLNTFFVKRFLWFSWDTICKKNYDVLKFEEKGSRGSSKDCEV